MKIKRTNYENEKTILMFAGVDFVGVPVEISDVGITANSDGKKLVPRGTIVSKTGSEANTSDAYGVLMNTADVTYGPVAETVVIEGHVNAANLPSAPTSNAVSALTGITFHNTAAIKGITVTMAAGSGATKTVVTAVSPSVPTDYDIKYKVGASISLPAYDAADTGYTALELDTDLTAASGNDCAVVFSKDGKVKYAGKATVVLGE